MDRAQHSVRIAIIMDVHSGCFCSVNCLPVKLFTTTVPLMMDPGQRPRFTITLDTPELLDAYRIQQRRLARTAVLLLKVGGVLVYSTCTVRAVLEPRFELAVTHSSQSCCKQILAVRPTALRCRVCPSVGSTRRKRAHDRCDTQRASVHEACREYSSYR